MHKVVFAATPHTGSQQASFLEWLSFLAWPSTIESVLVANDPALRSINFQYRQLAQSRKETLRHLVFYETLDTAAGRIVDEASADPGLPDVRPIPVDADHISIVKPVNCAELLYIRTRDFISEALEGSSDVGPYRPLQLPLVSLDHPWNILPKAIRLAALVTVGVLVLRGSGKFSRRDLLQLNKRIDEQHRLIDEGAVKRHKETLEEIKTLQVALAEERGVAPEVLTPLFEKMGLVGLSVAEMREKAPAAIKALIALSERGVEPSSEGADIDSTIKASRAKLAGLDIAAAQSILDQKIAEEERARKQRLVPLFVEKANIERLSFDYEGAKSALQELLKLDMDRVQSWVDLGDVWTTIGDLDEASKAFQMAIAAARRKGNELDLSKSLNRFGNIQVGLGDLEAALKSYSESLSIIEKLLQSDQNNTELRRDMSVSHNKIGNVRIAQGDLRGALSSYSSSLAIAEGLVKSDPSNMEWQHDLSVSYDNIGDVQLKQGNHEEALNAYSRSLVISEKLARAEPNNAKWQHDLSVSYNKLGSIQIRQDDLKGALKSYSDSLAITERLARSDPGNARWQRDLSISFDNVGDVLLKQGDEKGALKYYSDSLSIRERLTSTYPENATWQRELSVSYRNLAEIYRKMNNVSGAREALVKGRTIIANLLADHPDWTQWKEDLAWFDNQICELDRTLSNVSLGPAE